MKTQCAACNEIIETDYTKYKFDSNDNWFCDKQCYLKYKTTKDVFKNLKENMETRIEQEKTDLEFYKKENMFEKAMKAQTCLLCWQITLREINSCIKK